MRAGTTFKHYLSVLAQGLAHSRCSKANGYWMPPALNKAFLFGLHYKATGYLLFRHFILTVCGDMGPEPSPGSGVNRAATSLLFGNCHKWAGFAPHLCFPEEKPVHSSQHVKGTKLDSERWGHFLKMWILKSLPFYALGPLNSSIKSQDPKSLQVATGSPFFFKVWFLKFKTINPVGVSFGIQQTYVCDKQ